MDKRLTLRLLAGVGITTGLVVMGVILLNPRADTPIVTPVKHGIPAELFQPATRRPAPRLAGTILQGNPNNLKLGNAVRLVNFWASWCVPCRKEAPELARYSRMRDGATLVGVDTSDTESAGRSFIHRYHWRFTNITDSDGSLASDYRIPGLPTTIFVDSHGRIAALLAGPQTVATLRAAASSIASSK